MGFFQPHGGYLRRDGEAIVRNLSSCPAWCRASTSFVAALKTWMAGTSPAMTDVGSVTHEAIPHPRCRLREGQTLADARRLLPAPLKLSLHPWPTPLTAL